MKYSLPVVIALGALLFAFPPEIKAQTCTSPVVRFTGTFSVSGTGSGTDSRGFAWKVSENASAAVDAPQVSASCATVLWASIDTSVTGSVNDKGVAPCPPQSAVTQQTTSLTGSAVGASRLLSIDISKGT